MPSPVEHFAVALRVVREAAGITRSELARRCGVKPPVVTRWESGVSPLSEATARKYAAALGVSVRLVFE